MSLHSVSGTGKDLIHLFLCLVPYGTRGKCPSFCCKDSFVTFLNCSFTRTYIHLQLNTLVRPLLAMTGEKPGTLDAWIAELEGDVFLCAKLCRSASSGIVTRVTHCRPNITERVLESSLTRIHRKTIYFCSKWQWYWQWHRWCFSHNLHTGLTNANCRPNVPVWSVVPVVHRFAGVRAGHDKHSHPT